MKKLVFQDTWAKPIIGDDALVSQVRCTIYNKILRKPKFLAPKFDTLHKHIGRRKATIPSLGVAIGEYYYCNGVTHCKNERAFIRQNSKTVMTLIQSWIHFDVQKKFSLLSSYTYSCMEGPCWNMNPYGNFFLLLKVKSTPLKH